MSTTVIREAITRHVLCGLVESTQMVMDDHKLVTIFVETIGTALFSIGLCESGNIEYYTCNQHGEKT